MYPAGPPAPSICKCLEKSLFFPRGALRPQDSVFSRTPDKRIPVAQRRSLQGLSSTALREAPHCASSFHKRTSQGQLRRRSQTFLSASAQEIPPPPKAPPRAVQTQQLQNQTHSLRTP